MTRGHYKTWTGIKKNCLNCGKEYEDVLNRRKYFCSLKCFGSYKQQPYVCAFCHTEYLTSSTRNTKYCSKKCMFDDWRGKVKPAWIGEKISKGKLKGKQPSNGRELRHLAKWKKCRKSVLLRDGFTCQVCFEAGLDVHHIKKVNEHPELAYELTNLITVCKKCHDKKISKHEEQWETYFLSLIKLYETENN